MNLHKLLTPEERTVFRALSTPQKIQDFLETLPSNHEPHGDTALSPRRVLREGRAHCIEGALVAALALWYHGEKPLILDLVSSVKDVDHVVALYKRRGHWGAISKTNHAVLRYREPVYESIHELVMSYFHEYFLDDGTKTLRNYAGPIDLSTYHDTSWITSEDNLWPLIDWINAQPHYDVVDRAMIRNFRKADEIERKAGKLTEWERR